jgi:hypothetical protein
MTLHTAAPWVRTWLDGIAEEAERADEAARNAEAVAAAHAVIRSQYPHKVSDIRRACAVLLQLGNPDQQDEADKMLQSLALPHVRPRRVTVRPAPTPAQRIGRRMARDVLLGALVTVWAVYFLLIVVMA